AEEHRQGWRPACSDQPEPAIRSRAEDEIVPAKKVECLGDVMRAKRRDIGADQHRRPGRACGKGVEHAFAEIAPALPANRDTTRPETLAIAGAVRCDGQTHMPSPVSAEAVLRSGEH